VEGCLSALFFVIWEILSEEGRAFADRDFDGSYEMVAQMLYLYPYLKIKRENMVYDDYRTCAIWE
jgi:hypothetical protein